MLKIKKENLLFAAAIVWLIAGCNILSIGINSFVGSWSNNAAHNAILVFLSFLVFVGFVFMFRRIVSKNEIRILNYKNEKMLFLHMFDAKGYLTMAFMMVLGIVLRKGNFLPEKFFAFFYTGLGMALAISGVLFGVKWCRAR
ncbi:MAG: hypothetical protein IJ002_08525 [Clostridia bacterium]|nr:hypothetical protein [Clostridia bacterium]